MLTLDAKSSISAGRLYNDLLNLFDIGILRPRSEIIPKLIHCLLSALDPHLNTTVREVPDVTLYLMTCR